MQWAIMRAFNTIISICTLSGICFASSLTLIACQKKHTEETVQPSTHEGDKPDVQCGGFGGSPCSDGMTCVDDPSDSCDPMQGGADCMGTCVEDKDPAGDDVDVGKHQPCDFTGSLDKTYVGKSPDACMTMRFACDAGKEYFSDDCGCGCVTSGMTEPGVTPPPGE